MVLREITIESLRSGAIPHICGKELARLRGRSLSTIEKERTTGAGVPYIKDPVTGCISYRAEDVLKFFERGKPCLSTAQYDTTSHSQRLEKARAILARRRLRTGIQ
jgi:hypothetical protein